MCSGTSSNAMFSDTNIQKIPAKIQKIQNTKSEKYQNARGVYEVPEHTFTPMRRCVLI